MIKAVLERRQAARMTRIGVKALIAAGIIALAVLLPQLAHMTYGAQAGIVLLPMYLPVLLGGCLLGARWGLCVGVLSPLVSFLITSVAGAPMPALARLPFMMAELAVFALVTGLFSGRIERNGLMAFPAVVLAQLSGRAFFLLAVAALQRLSAAAPFTAAVIWGQIRAGVPGLVLQAVLAPLLIMGLRLLLQRGVRHA